MRGLKALVIIMGMLIVAGFAVIVVTLINRSVGGDGAPAKTVAAKPYNTKIPIPDGARIVDTEAGDGRLIIHLTLPDAESQILIVDPATGRRIGTIDLP